MRYLLSAILSICALSASAQFVPSSFEAPARMNIAQIDNREFSTLVFFDYTVPEDSTWMSSHQWMNFRDKILVVR